MKYFKTSLLGIVYLTLTVNSSSSSSSTDHDEHEGFGSNDTESVVYPMSCYECKEHYGFFNFCNINNEYGACCNPRSTDSHNCVEDTSHNILCTNEYENEDLYWTKCLKTYSK
jgi:hypothetical protein